MKTFLLMSAASLALAGPAALARTQRAPAAQSAPADAAPLAPLKVGRWCVDLSARALSLRPGDDFEHHASGTCFRKPHKLVSATCTERVGQIRYLSEADRSLKQQE